MNELPEQGKIFLSDEEFDALLRSSLHVLRSEAKRRLSNMHSLYRLRSRKRVRR